ncbi:MAG: hypothetical protein JW881_18185, partial [Spirochaetales bacterium]|nr:hypothetical protein [Spirochaetales bacterium]
MKQVIKTGRNGLLLVMLFILLPAALYAWDPASHVYMSLNMKDIWKDYDPEFYDAITKQNILDETSILTNKFYYIGTTLPDMLDESGQNSIRNLINKLYKTKDKFPGWILDLSFAFDIREHTYDNIQSKIDFIDSPPNQNIEKIKEMVKHAKDQKWEPYKKAMIYGCYVHLLQDAVAHMVMQPAIFGYGKAIESPAMKNDGLLTAGEYYHEIFTPTFITNWDEIDRHLFFGIERKNPKVIPKRAFLQFYNEWNALGEHQGWQDMNFLAVEGFVEAAKAVNYKVNNLTQERMESYMHGWGISLFVLMGYRWDGSDKGGILGHPNWSPYDLITYIGDIGNQNVRLLDIPILHDLIILKVGDVIKIIMKIIKIILWISLEYCTANDPWPSYLESVTSYENLWKCVPEDKIPDDKNKYKSMIQYYQDYSTNRKPNLRSTYADQLEEGLNFKGFIKDMIDGREFIWYKTNGNDTWNISRKAGLLGAMFDIDSSCEYYLQPGIFDIHFERDGKPVYSEQDVEEGTRTTIQLLYDVIPFGKTKICIIGKKEDKSWKRLKSVILDEKYRRVRGTIPLDVTDAIDNGYKNILFEVMTENKNQQGTFTTMILSDYETAYNSTNKITGNTFYNSLFNDGNPERTIVEPFWRVKKYWPYVIKLIPVKKTIAELANLNAEIYDDTKIKISWSKGPDSYTWYEIIRKDTKTGTTKEWDGITNTFFIDNEITIYNNTYRYGVRGYNDNGRTLWLGPVERYIPKIPTIKDYVPHDGEVVYNNQLRVEVFSDKEEVDISFYGGEWNPATGSTSIDCIGMYWNVKSETGDHYRIQDTRFPHLENSGAYKWYVVIDDGEKIYTSPIWSFYSAIDYGPCYAPLPPSAPEPEDEAAGVSTSVTLNVNVFDPDGDAMNVTFYGGPLGGGDGGDTTIGTDDNVPSGGTASITWSGLEHGQRYWWYASAHDGEQSNVPYSTQWTFTTETLPAAPVSNPKPAPGANDVSTNPAMCVNVDYATGLEVV